MENSSVKQSLKYEEIEKILRDMVSKSGTELCNELKSEKKKNPSSDVLMKPKIFISIQRPDNSEVVNAIGDERKHTGRKMKNHVVGEKVVCFKLPDDFDGESIQDIDKIKERLGKWRLQRRQRESKMKDTFYCHLSSQRTFRTIPEVLNFIMSGSPAKSSSQKRKARDDQASTSCKQYRCECSKKNQSDPEPLRNITCEPESKLNEERNMVIEEFVEDNEIDSNSEMSEVTQEKAVNSLSESYLKSARDDVDETYYGLEILDEYKKLLGGTTFDDLLGESNDKNNVSLITSRANKEEIGKDKYAEKQALITTKPVESLTVTESSNKQNKNLQDNFGAAENDEIEGLEEAKQNLPYVELEGVERQDEFYHFQLGGYFSQLDPVNQISIYDYIW